MIPIIDYECYRIEKNLNEYSTPCPDEKFRICGTGRATFTSQVVELFILLMIHR